MPKATDRCFLPLMDFKIAPWLDFHAAAASGLFVSLSMLSLQLWRFRNWHYTIQGSMMLMYHLCSAMVHFLWHSELQDDNHQRDFLDRSGISDAQYSICKSYLVDALTTAIFGERRHIGVGLWAAPDETQDAATRSSFVVLPSFHFPIL